MECVKIFVTQKYQGRFSQIVWLKLCQNVIFLAIPQEICMYLPEWLCIGERKIIRFFQCSPSSTKRDILKCNIQIHRLGDSQGPSPALNYKIEQNKPSNKLCVSLVRSMDLKLMWALTLLYRNLFFIKQNISLRICFGKAELDC